MRAILFILLLVIGTALAGCLTANDTPVVNAPSTTDTAAGGAAAPAGTDDGHKTTPAVGATTDGGAVPPANLPPGCDADRSAIAHHPGGVAVEPPHAAPVPCLTRTGFTSLEPTLGATASGAVFLYPASDNVGLNDGAVSGVRTTDGGATWEPVTPTLQGQPTHRGSMDPYMYVDPATSRVFFDDLTAAVTCSVFSWSDDDGANWGHSYSGCMEFDHQTIFAGPPSTSATIGYPNVVYRCAINTVALAGASTTSTCQRSLDGGLTWLPPGEPAFVTPVPGKGHDGAPWCDGATGHGVVDAEGTVYLPKGLCDQPWLAISHDEGLTWTRVQVADNGMRVDEDGGHSHEAGVAVDAAGNVYYLWVARDRMPHLAISSDGGETWSDPLNVAPPGLTQASLPALTAGGAGRVALAYIGSENAPAAPFDSCEALDRFPETCPDGPSYDNVTWNGYLAMSTDALAADPIFHTASVNDPADPLVVGYCGGTRCQEVYDFIDVIIAPDGTPWAPYVDGCTPGACEPDDGELGEGVAGRLWGGPSLWGPEDPSGPYP